MDIFNLAGDIAFEAISWKKTKAIYNERHISKKNTKR